MKITEIDWTDGKKYRINDRNELIVVGKELYYLIDLERDITKKVSLKTIIELDFTEIVDWSKIAVDTPIWVSQSKHIDYWFPAHYCRTDSKGRIIAWTGGKTSHTTTETSPWHHASLTDPTK